MQSEHEERDSSSQTFVNGREMAVAIGFGLTMALVTSIADGVGVLIYFAIATAVLGLPA